MKNLKFLIISSIIFSMQAVPITTDFKVGIGPGWNEIYGIQHFNLVNGGQEGKLILQGPNNPLVSFEEQLIIKFGEHFFFKLNAHEMIGRNGLLFFNRSLQENPFAFINNLDGDMSTRVISGKIIAGYTVDVCDYAKLNLGLGFYPFRAKRPVCFFESNDKIILRDAFNSAIGMLEVIVNPTPKTEILALLYGNITPLKVSIERFPTNDTIFLYFPQFIGVSTILEGKYHFTDRVYVAASAAFLYFQSTKRGRVQLPPAENALFTDNFMSFFRSQYFVLSFLMGCKF